MVSVREIRNNSNNVAFDKTDLLIEEVPDNVFCNLMDITGKVILFLSSKLVRYD